MRITYDNGKVLTISGTDIPEPERVIAIDCSRSILSNLNWISKCTSLQTLYCEINKLTSLNGLENCTALKTLYCSKNKLVSLKGLENCTSLQTLWCTENKLTSLTGLENCTVLQNLVCKKNKLVSLQGLKNCTSLQRLWCNENNLTSLAGSENCKSLQNLYCEGNNLTSLPVFLTEFRSLHRFLYDNNPIETIPVQVVRFIQRIGNKQTSKYRVYTDGQNVHNSAIAKSIKTSINNLMNQPVNKSAQLKMIFT